MQNLTYYVANVVHFLIHVYTLCKVFTLYLTYWAWKLLREEYKIQNHNNSVHPYTIYTCPVAYNPTYTPVRYVFSGVFGYLSFPVRKVLYWGHLASRFHDKTIPQTEADEWKILSIFCVSQKLWSAHIFFSIRSTCISHLDLDIQDPRGARGLHD